MGSGASAQQPTSFVTFEEFKALRVAFDSLPAGLPDSEVLEKLKATLDKAKEDGAPKATVVLSMKSPKVAERQGAGGVFFNAAQEVKEQQPRGATPSAEAHTILFHVPAKNLQLTQNYPPHQEDFATQGEDDEDNAAMVADLKFMASGGDADSAFDLGVIYRTGSYGVAKDHGEVVKWWKKAADGFVVDAAYNLAVMFHHGQGVDVDLPRAVEFYKRAAELGNQEAAGMIATLKQTIEMERTSGKFFDDAASEGETLEWFER